MFAVEQDFSTHEEINKFHIQIGNPTLVISQFWVDYLSMQDAGKSWHPDTTP